MNEQQPENLQNYPQIVDGFCYSGLYGNRPLTGLSWFWNCLGNMEALRVAADRYRPRQWVIPNNFTNPANANNANIAPGRTFFYEFQIKPGSYLYGMQFAVFDEEIAQSKFSVIIRESATDLGFSDRPFQASMLFSGSPVDPFNTLKAPMKLLPEPRLILDPGQIHVELSNDADPGDDENAVSCQLILLFAEPK